MNMDVSRQKLIAKRRTEYAAKTARYGDLQGMYEAMECIMLGQ